MLKRLWMLSSLLVSIGPVSASDLAIAFGHASLAASGQLESNDVVHVQVPDSDTSARPDGTVLNDGLFTNRADANYRYTSNTQVLASMMAAGYNPEGDGTVGVALNAASAATPIATPPIASIVVTEIAPDTFGFGSMVLAMSSITGVSYLWSFGDGSTASGATASHRYTTSGTYPVVLIVTDSVGNEEGAIKTVDAVVTAAAPPPPLVPTVTPGSWGQYGSSYTAGTEAEYQSWYNLACDSKRDVFYGVDWGGDIAAFNPGTGTWQKLTPTSSFSPAVHNRTLTYDPINDRVWLAGGTGSQLVGMNYYDPVAANWVNYPMPRPLPGGESAMIFDPAGKRFVVFGGWGRLGVYTFPLSPPGSSLTSANVPDGPTWDGGIVPDAKKMTAWRSDLDTKRNRIVYVDTDGSLWALPLNLSGWVHLSTTGGPPPALTQYVYDRADDALVGWASSPRIAGGDTTPGTTRETWLLPLSSLVWTKGANAAAGNTVPAASIYVGYAMGYDPARQLTILHTLTGESNFSPTTWAYRYPVTTTAPPPPPPPPPGVSTTTGRITSFPLPAQSGSTYGVNYYGFPFVSNGISKQSDIAYCPANNRLYAQGGDTIHSATDGTWSMSLVDGSWRLDVGQPVYPTMPAPHALQDDFGIAWMPKRQQFVLWPGSYFAYDNGNNPPDPAVYPLLNYSRGVWFFDPATKTYTQYTQLFPDYLVGDTGTGSPHGGIYDDVNDQIVEFGDSAKAFAVRRWDLTNLVRLPDIPFRVPLAAGTAAYFTRGMHVKIGRSVYIIGYRTNGNVSSQTPLMLRWDLDNQVMQELAAPPVDGTLIRDLEIRIGTSNGKVVWPFGNGPDGEIHGIYVYDPATNGWAVDNQVPAYGNFIGNVLTSLPDGRVAWSGGVFGRQQTHIWFYQAN